MKGDGKDDRLFGARTIARNSAGNFGTRVVLSVLALGFVPFMVDAFGMELYGVLTVTWMLLGQASGFTIGLTRASAKYIAEDLAAGTDRAGWWTWIAVLGQTALGSVIAVALWIAAPWLVELLNVASGRSALALDVIRIFAIAIPLHLAASAADGALEATQRFDRVNALKVFDRLWTYGVYLIGILRGGDLRAVAFGLVLLQLAHFGLAYAAAARELPSLRSLRALPRLAPELGGRVRELIGFGGWVSANAMLAAFASQLDRWIIGALGGAAMLPLFTIPYNLLRRLRILPVSLTATLFPAFSAMQAQQGWERIQDYYVRAHRYLLIVLAPIVFVLFVWAHELLRLWMGSAFAAEAALPLRVLLIGFGLALLRPLSGTLIQGAGRPDLLTKLQVALLPGTALLVWFLVGRYGIVGAAVAYTVRVYAQTLVIWLMLHRGFPLSFDRLVRHAFRPFAPALGLMLVAGFVLPSPDIGSVLDVGATAAIGLAYVGLLLVAVLDDRDRSLVRRVLERR